MAVKFMKLDSLNCVNEVQDLRGDLKKIHFNRRNLGAK